MRSSGNPRTHAATPAVLTFALTFAVGSSSGAFGHSGIRAFGVHPGRRASKPYLVVPDALLDLPQDPDAVLVQRGARVLHVQRVVHLLRAGGGGGGTKGQRGGLLLRWTMDENAIVGQSSGAAIVGSRETARLRLARSRVTDTHTQTHTHAAT